ncbi:MAG TPA: phosphoglycerate dehydrogenase [Bryobacteraceae bacterium]|jgi:D-3-phosphoglycerate dehydrogenase|nr:phosphoglycerate dehydrogenase [Bryobacteraceae bacterium]
MKILVAEPLADAGLELLRAQKGWDIVVSNPEEFQKHLADADALIVRTEVKVDRGVLAKATRLKVVGRAGIGIENVDVDAATAAGVLVMNTPGGNAVSVAEHTMGLMLSMARSIPQAIASTKSGKWEEKKFLGTELRGKTLGVVGLGSIGREVVRRARGFEMRIVASDPYVNSRAAADLSTTLLSLDELYAESDYITLHVALTTETYGMLNDAAFARMKKGVRIVNCARGELIDGEALRKAIESGKVAGAALDVFQTEPPVSEPLLAFENVLATPHIGGSTHEAQDAVGYRIAEQVVEYLRDGVALNAVNVPAMTAEQYRTVGPYAALAERLGTFAAYVATGNPRLVRLVYKGRIAEQNTLMIRNAGLAGVLSRSLARKANVINAIQFAADRGVGFAERHEISDVAGQADSVRLELETDSGVTTVEGSVVLDRPRLLRVDGIYCEAPLTGHLMFLKNADVPGVIGYVGSVTGKHNINIASFSLGRQEQASNNGPLQAVAVVETDGPVPESVLKQLLENKAVTVARAVEFRA